MTQNHVHIQTTTKNWPWDLSKLPPPPPSYPIENVQEGFLPMFYYGKGGGWRRQFIGVLGLKFVHGPSVNMILGRIPLIENFSMTSYKLLLGYSEHSKRRSVSRSSSEVVCNYKGTLSPL